MDRRKYNVGATFGYLSPESKAFIDKVLKEFNLTIEQMTSTRIRPVPQIKQVLYWFLVNKFKEGYSAIGRHFGNNHATIIHSCKQAELIKEFTKDRYHYIYEKIINIYNEKDIYSACLDVAFELNYRRNANR